MLGRDLVSVLSAPFARAESRSAARANAGARAASPAFREAPALYLADLDNCDITQPDALMRFFDEARPDVVVHAAAYTDVDGCERDPERAMRANAEGTKNVARAAAAFDARLIYISTDYVFDGRKGSPYDECDPPNPRSAYGRSKLAGEQAVRENADHAILRTAWLYGQHGRNFVTAILERARKGEPLRVVDDQVGSPTWSRDLAGAIAALVPKSAAGIFHATGAGQCSWFEFAEAILDEAASLGQVARVPVVPISTVELARAAPRPAFSVLGNRRLRESGVAPLPHWRDSLRAFLKVVASDE